MWCTAEDTSHPEELQPIPLRPFAPASASHALGSQGSGGILPCSPDSTAAPTSGTTKPPVQEHVALGDSSTGSSACWSTPAMAYDYLTTDYGHQDSSQAQICGDSAVICSLQAQTAPGTMGWCPGAAGLNDPNALYQLTLTKISRNIEDGKLVTASNSLLAVSHWLLSQVVELGLTSDGQSQYEEWKLWNDFYETWLAILQRQKDMMESGLQLQYGQTLVPEEGLKKIRDDLARLCDSIKQYNLYWKGRIVPVLRECLKLYSFSSTAGDDSDG